MEKKMCYVLDIQGFRRSSNLIAPKEIAIVPLDEDVPPKVLHFLPPCKWSSLLHQERWTNKWLELYFHGIPWSSGKIPYGELVSELQESLKNAKLIYVKGLEKKKWLEETLPRIPVYNMEMLGCENLKILNEERASSCHLHTSCKCEPPVCAAQNVILLKEWLAEHNAKTYTISTSTSSEEEEEDYDL